MSTATASPAVKLNSGYEIPLVGFGCWKLTNDVASDQIYRAIKSGYRLFDGAEDYANEQEVGEGIKRAIKEGIVKREELFITSKLWNSFHDKKNVEVALMKTLSDLNLDYVDLFYIHFPIAQKPVPIEKKYPPGFYCGDGDKWSIEEVPLLDTWRALEKLVDQGLAKSIGISNFSAQLIYDLIRGCTIKPVALQIEHHPYLTQPKLVEYVQLHDIQITGYSSFGPQSFLEMDLKRALDTPVLLEEPTVKSIADKHGKSPAQVLLRYQTQRGIAVIPRSNSPDRMAQNLSVIDFELTQDDLQAIAELDCNLRFNEPWDFSNIPVFV
uniref:NADH-dependent D-xylose reductase n=1 Tax=Candida parapsilosis TaxID=5480 RepID=XYL1_CANPA|nr:RecName: Full=NADH-dependent D-xylose reductase; Short=XR [Candida parapsilosis]AAO91803.1 xylose reductase [Candida parapsilosis]